MNGGEGGGDSGGVDGGGGGDGRGGDDGGGDDGGADGGGGDGGGEGGGESGGDECTHSALAKLPPADAGTAWHVPSAIISESVYAPEQSAAAKARRLYVVPLQSWNTDVPL